MTEKNAAPSHHGSNRGGEPHHRGPASRARSWRNLVAVYGLLVAFSPIMLIFGLLRPSSFFSATNINAILVGQSVTATPRVGRDDTARHQTV